MNHLVPFDGFLTEETTVYQFPTSFAIDATAKKVSYTPLLHHFTTFESLLGILKDDTLFCGEPYQGEKTGAVSLTYNADLPNTLEDLELSCRLSLDKELLEKKYKLVPYLFVPKGKKFSWECKDEMEEQVREDIKKISRYLVRIDVLGKAAAVKKLQREYSKLKICSVKKFI